MGQRLERLLDAVRAAPRYPRQIMVDTRHERSVLVSVDRVVAERNDHRLVTRSVEVTRREPRPAAASDYSSTQGTTVA